ncbi:hypothetical protein PFICI_03867 [Pestalotiopsis fici W106-1]|uniref:Uncharacterized protein n=1 Tax=Pestalotiopsis fici (strain W106-1 / CGMCC3.15140) TaxID=1229662 RepID=W3XK52_PESFW|nr:uncharacterized protein PFICI_03867 [Pestalotiopsis fici W106-1]ETS85842.1 hypothetical protein PFICI_03867 [Pestalotiopsis fici W106-1]
MSQPISPYGGLIGLNSPPTSLSTTNTSTEAAMAWNSKEMFASEYLRSAEYCNIPGVAEEPVSSTFSTSSRAQPLIADFEPFVERAPPHPTTEPRTRSVTEERGWPWSDLDGQNNRPATVQNIGISNSLSKEVNGNFDIHQKNTSSIIQSDIDGHCQLIESSERLGSSSDSERVATTEVDPGSEKSNSGSCTRPSPDSSLSDRLSHLMECSKQLGFDDLDDALLCYYTSDVRDSALLSHKQSLSRARKLSHFLSDIREHSKAWSNWERADFMREIVKSAEEIYVEECMVARKHQVDINIGDFTKDSASVEHVSQKLKREVRISLFALLVHACTSFIRLLFFFSLSFKTLSTDYNSPLLLLILEYLGSKYLGFGRKHNATFHISGSSSLATNLTRSYATLLPQQGPGKGVPTVSSAHSTAE